MSDLPQINPDRVSEKLLGKLVDSQRQLAQLETLAEALRDERDTARNERDSAYQELSDIRRSLESEEDSGETE